MKKYEEFDSKILDTLTCTKQVRCKLDEIAEIINNARDIQEMHKQIFNDELEM